MLLAGEDPARSARQLQIHRLGSLRAIPEQDEPRLVVAHQHVDVNINASAGGARVGGAAGAGALGGERENLTQPGGVALGALAEIGAGVENAAFADAVEDDRRVL